MIKLSVIAQKINGKIRGNPDKLIKKISDANLLEDDSLFFIFKDIDLDKFFEVKNPTFVTSSEVSNLIPENFDTILVSNVQCSLALVSGMFVEKNFQLKSNNINISGINSDILKNKSFSYGCNCVIEDNVNLGNNVTIKNNVVIHKGVQIGNNVFIDSGTVIGSEGFGNFRKEDGSWSHIHHLGKVVIGDNVYIGSNVNIDRGTIGDTIIFNGVIIDNQVHIAHNVVIGENTAIAANTAIAGSCHIGKRNMIGGMVGIIDHITTCDDVTISATSSIISDINRPGVYSGIMPTVEHSQWKRIALLIKKIDKMFKKINFKKT